MWCTGKAGTFTTAPSSRSRSHACWVTPPPQSFLRGKTALSISIVRAASAGARCAKRSAAADPQGPPPTMMTSYSFILQLFCRDQARCPFRTLARDETYTHNDQYESYEGRPFKRFAQYERAEQNGDDRADIRNQRGAGRADVFN